MIKENAIEKIELTTIPTIKRIRKRTKQIMIVMSAAVFVLVSVAISLYLCLIDLIRLILKIFAHYVNPFYLYIIHLLISFIDKHYLWIFTFVQNNFITCG